MKKDIDYMKQRILELLLEINPLAEITSYDSPLISSGDFDSFNMFSAIVLFELEWGISFLAKDIKRENFDTINNIANTIEILLG